MRDACVAVSFPARVLCVLALAAGCAGGGGATSAEDLVIEGTLIQGADPHHDRALFHSAGQTIGEVEICALGRCSVTDDNGRWGFLVEGDFAGGPVFFTVNGHGIAAETLADIPAHARDVLLELENRGSSGVVVTAIVADGEVVVEHGAEAEHHDEQ